MASSSLQTSFLGALQASFSVLLTIFYGVLAGQYDLVRGESTKDISKLCVRMFLPALLITSVGSELYSDTISRYVPIVIWSFVFILSSLAFSVLLTRIFKLPAWVTPATTFNNTTSLPLLLIQSLEATGILSRLIVSSDDDTDSAIKRAKSYFLVCSVISNSMTFALSSRLLDGEEPEEEDADKDGDADAHEGDRAAAHASRQEDGDPQGPHETTTLLPISVYRSEQTVQERGYRKGKVYWDRLSPRAQTSLDVIYAFFNAPLIGAIIGIIVGVVPGFHKAFFADSQDGGFFNAWLTSSVKNIGDLFATLQVVVVGVKLSSSLRKMKRGEDSGHVPWAPSLFVLTMRFAVWPALSISIIWAVASKTNWLSDDPMLWFVLMLIPTGPTAMNLVAAAEVIHVDEMERMSIAKFLTLSYALSPLLCFSVVMALKACESAIGKMG